MFFFNYYWKYVIKPDNYINNNNNDVVIVGIMERNLYNLKLKKKNRQEEDIKMIRKKIILK